MWLICICTRISTCISRLFSPRAAFTACIASSSSRVRSTPGVSKTRQIPDWQSSATFKGKLQGYHGVLQDYLAPDRIPGIYGLSCIYCEWCHAEEH